MNKKILLAGLLACLSLPSIAEISKGKYQTLANLHPDLNRALIYTANYQLQGGLIPMCSEVEVKKVKKKALVFVWQEREYTLKWEKHTKNAGKSLQDVAQLFFGEKCDADKVKKLSKVDREGIEAGVPMIGMSKQAVLYAMGRPPFHANYSTDAKIWTYWRNKFARTTVTFDDKGIVKKIN